MKICLIMAGDEEGGLEQHFVELCNGLAESCEIMVIAHPKYLSRFIDTVIFKAIDLTKSRNNVAILWKITACIRTWKPDIVHAQANKATSLLTKIRHFISAKTIATIHNQKKKTAMFEKMDCVIGVSKAVLSGIRNNNKKVIYNGVDARKLKVSESLTNKLYKQKHNEVVVLAIGRLVVAKGFDNLLKAWGGIDAKLWILGEGEQKNELLQLSNELGIEDKVQFFGFCENIASYMDISDFVVISSRKEGFSYVCAEALLMETPVIATNVPVANEILPEEYICEINDIDSLHQLIHRTITDLENIKLRYQDLFNFSQEVFTLEAMVSRTIEVYVQCLTGKGDNLVEKI